MKKKPPPATSNKLNPALIAKLASRPNQEQPVTVTFNTPHSADDMTALGLSGDGTTAYGELDANAIHALAARSDVVLIAYRPEHFSR